MRVLAFPLVTPRLELSPLTRADRDAFVAYRRVPEVARWQGWHSDYSETDADALLAAQPTTISPGSGRWLQIAVRRHGGLVGDVGVHPLAAQPDTYELG